MKRIIVSIALLALGYGANAQIKSNLQILPEINNSNAFLDASSNFSIKSNDNKTGKGLVFPDTDLTSFEFDLSLADGQTFPTWFNGMVVYNIGTGKTGANANTQGIQVDVTPGFYYFSNPNGATTQSVRQGKWVHLGTSNITNDNIYTANGTLTGNRLISSGNNTLTIEGNHWTPLRINSTNTSGIGGGGISIYPNDIDKRVELSTTLDGNFRLWAGGADRLFVNRTNGHIGIGINSPKSRLHVAGGAMITGGGNLGGTLSLENSAKTGNNQVSRWNFFNMTDTDPNTPGGYNDGLVLWGYNKDASQGSGPRLMITDSGSLIIGGKYTYNNVILPTEKLVVDGNAKIQSLSGTGDRIVVADQDGVLKTSQFIMKATDTTDGCSETNEGAIHYKTIMKNGKQVGVFGFCTRNARGDFMWTYSVGGNNMLDGTGAFGSGL